jgi:hypothetical protein
MQKEKVQVVRHPPVIKGNAKINPIGKRTLR